MYEIAEGGLRLRVELGVDSPETVENADGWLLLPDGSRWSATFLTYAELGRLMDRWAASGECLGGRYFTCPDLVLIRDPGTQKMFAAAKDLVASGEYEVTLGRLDPE